MHTTYYIYFIYQFICQLFYLHILFLTNFVVCAFHYDYDYEFEFEFDFDYCVFLCCPDLHYCYYTFYVWSGIPLV